MIDAYIHEYTGRENKVVFYLLYWLNCRCYFKKYTRPRVKKLFIHQILDFYKFLKNSRELSTISYVFKNHIFKQHWTSTDLPHEFNVILYMTMGNIWIILKFKFDSGW